MENLVAAVTMFVCRVCCGEGAQASLCDLERDRGITDFCYHCMGTGKVNAETDYQDRVKAMICGMARDRVRADQREANELGPYEGYDYALAAAENGMSLRDFTTECCWAEEGKLEEKFAKLSPAELDFLLAGYEGAR